MEWFVLRGHEVGFCFGTRSVLEAASVGVEVLVHLLPGLNAKELRQNYILWPLSF